MVQRHRYQFNTGETRASICISIPSTLYHFSNRKFSLATFSKEDEYKHAGTAKGGEKKREHRGIFVSHVRGDRRAWTVEANVTAEKRGENL